MSRWFRFYDDAINDPKILKLSDECFRGWVAILCVTSKNKGKIPCTQDLSFHLRMKSQRVAALITQLVSAGLIDKTEDGFEVHNWAGRQYVSDSTERVKRHRDKRAAAGLDAQWSAPKALRKHVYSRDNYECVYCESPDDLTLDHKIPEMRGGTHDESNLQTACRKCNASKRDLTHEEFVTRNVTETVTSTVTDTFQKRPQTTEQTSEQNTQQSRADASAPVDEDSKKKLVALQFGITALFISRQQAVPNLDRCALWFAQGYASGTVLGAIEAVLKRGKPISTLDYFDGAIRDRHAADLPVAALVDTMADWHVIIEGTTEEACWQQYSRETTGRPMFICDQIHNGNTVRGAKKPTLFPPGFNDFGERISPPENEENAA